MSNLAASEGTNVTDLRSAVFGRDRWTLGWAVLGLAVVGLGLTGYLSVSALSRGTIAGCGAGSGCDTAMSSAWAWWLDVPVSALAACVYGLVAVAACMAMLAGSRVRQLAWTVLPALALMLVGAAAWFVYLLAGRLGTMCLYCTASHVVGLVTAGLIVTGAAARREPAGRRRLVDAAQWTVAGVLAATGLAVLIGVQVLRPTPTYAMVDVSALSLPEDGQHSDDSHAGHDHGHGPGIVDGGALLSPNEDFCREINGRRVIAPAFTDIALDPHQLPMIGSPDAKHLLVLFFDYTCDSCREMHRQLRYAHQQFGNQIGVVLVPFPNGKACNSLLAERGLAGSENACKYARLGLALWRVSPEVFNQYEAWLLTFQKVPPLDVGVKRAIDLAGREALQAALADPWVEQQLQQYVQFARPAMEQLHATPVLLMGHQFMRGVQDNREELCQTLEKHLGLTRGR